MTTRLLLVDDHPLFRHGLAVALGMEHDLEVVAEAGHAAHGLELARTHTIDVAIVDLLMPEVSGISLAIELREQTPNCRVLGLSAIDEPCLIANMLRASACGYALKTQSVEEIVEAVRLVATGARYLPPTVSSDAIEAELAGKVDTPLHRLTRREREVFELVIRGQSDDDIAARLVIARRTVETHRQRIMNKLSVRSLVQMQRLAALHSLTM